MIKFSIVVFCFLYLIGNVILLDKKFSAKDLHSGGNKKYDRGYIYLVLALLFTVISDMFILLSEYYLYGVLTFIITQQFHGMRISELYNREQRKDQLTRPYRGVLIRFFYQATLALLVLFILWRMKVNVDALLGTSILYFICLCTNVLRSLRLSLSYPYRRDIRYFTIGFLLFLLCDINVGLFNLSDFLPLRSSYQIIYNISSILMWTFYAPSQVLITLSVHES
ncbi:MAG: hypothetical protein GX271_00455 [Clostridiales bacterium]|nr:hypothetical protein [Clostridiales bacterium]